MSFGPLELFIILVIVLLLFGTKRIKTIGSDMGSAIRNFRSAVKDGEADQENGGKGKAEDTKPHLEGKENGKA